jgi:PKD repeat protein
MKLILNVKRIFVIAFFLGAMANSYSLFGQNCPQNNIALTGFQLRNQDGEIFSTTDDYNLGDLVTGELWVYFGGSSTNGYNMGFYFDITVNDILKFNDPNGDGVHERQFNCLFPGSAIVKDQWVRIRDFTWNWGDVIEISNIYAYWDTNSGAPTCQIFADGEKLPNSQCYNNPTIFTAAVPLFPKFDFESNGVCSTTIQFTSQTIGGIPPFNYTFSWDFNNDGVFDSTTENPVYNFPSSGTYPITLRVNDGTSITTIVKDIFIDPNFGIQVDIFPTKNNDESGIIYVQSVTGGTPPYSFFWTGPNGFTSTDEDIFNLADGLYHLTVTDANGCQQTEQYFMDIASVLNLSWKSFELISRGDHVKLTWEMTSEAVGVEYQIHRSLGNITDFETIASVRGLKTISGTSNYEFEDSSIPRTHQRVYYRILRRMQGFSDYSQVKMIERPLLDKRDSWLIYPNPTSGGHFNLNFSDLATTGEVTVTLDIFGTGNFFKKESIPIKSGQTVDLRDIFGTLPKGIMILRIQDGKEVKVIKLINEN